MKNRAINMKKKGRNVVYCELFPVFLDASGEKERR